MLLWIRFMFIAVPSVQLGLGAGAGFALVGVFPSEPGVLWSVLSSASPPTPLQADSQVDLVRQHFYEVSLEYVFKVQEVQERKMFEFVEPVSELSICLSLHKTGGGVVKQGVVGGTGSGGAGGSSLTPQPLSQRGFERGKLCGSLGAQSHWLSDPVCAGNLSARDFLLWRQPIREGGLRGLRS